MSNDTTVSAVLACAGRRQPGECRLAFVHDSTAAPSKAYPPGAGRWLGSVAPMSMSMTCRSAPARDTRSSSDRFGAQLLVSTLLGYRDFPSKGSHRG